MTSDNVATIDKFEEGVLELARLMQADARDLNREDVLEDYRRQIKGLAARTSTLFADTRAAVHAKLRSLEEEAGSVRRWAYPTMLFNGYVEK